MKDSQSVIRVNLDVWPNSKHQRPRAQIRTCVALESNMLDLISFKRSPQLWKRSFSFLLLAATTLICLSKPASAQKCGVEYVVRSSDSLSKIALRTYGDTQKWTAIYNINLKIIGTNPNLIQIGQYLFLPCLDDSENSLTKAADPIQQESEISSDITSTLASDEQTDPPKIESSADQTNQLKPDPLTNDALPSSAASKDSTPDTIRFLTGGDYAPFTDRNLPNDGLITDIVVTAMSNTPGGSNFKIDWVDDWSLHLDELLPDLEYDMGFPWFKPDCESTPDDYRCENFVFSNPVFEMLILLFTHKDRPLEFNSDKDIVGAVLCRPNGYFTHDLEKDGRKWLTNKVIQLKQPDTIKECFEMLVDGDVDGVALNEFTGRTAIANLGLKNQVVALQNQPLSVEGLRVVVHKSHPRAQDLMNIFNKSMADLQLSENYSPIIEKHFRNYWTTID